MRKGEISLKKRTALPFLIVLLLCTNMVTLYLLIGSRFTGNIQEAAPDNRITVYQMEGKGEQWAVHDYKIVLTPQKIKRSLARLDYLGDRKQIDQSTYFSTEVVENDKSVLSNASTSINGSVDILLNLDNTRSIESEASESDRQLNEDSVRNTKVILTWKGNDGKLHEETVQLSITETLNF